MGLLRRKAKDMGSLKKEIASETGIPESQVTSILNKLQPYIKEEVESSVKKFLGRRTVLEGGVAAGTLLAMSMGISKAETIIESYPKLKIDLVRPSVYDILVGKEDGRIKAYDTRGVILADGKAGINDAEVFYKAQKYGGRISVECEIYGDIVIDTPSEVILHKVTGDVHVQESNITIWGRNSESEILGKILAEGKNPVQNNENKPIEYFKVFCITVNSGIGLIYNVNDFEIFNCKIHGDGIYSNGQAINGTIAHNHLRAKTYNIKFYSATGENGTRAEGNKIICNYIDGMLGCIGLYFYNSRNNIVVGNVLDNYYQTPVHIAGDIGLGHGIVGNIILVPNSDTCPAIRIDDSQHNTVAMNYITQADTGIYLCNTTNNIIGFNKFVAVNNRIVYDNSPKDVVTELDNVIQVNGMINTDIFSADYGGNFANFTPPTPIRGKIFLAQDTNLKSPVARLYVSPTGSDWRMAVLSENPYVWDKIGLSVVPGNAAWGTPDEVTFKGLITGMSEVNVVYNVAAGDTVLIQIYFIFSDGTVSTYPYEVTIDNSAGTTSKEGEENIPVVEMIDALEGKPIIGLGAKAQSSTGATTVGQTIFQVVCVC